MAYLQGVDGLVQKDHCMLGSLLCGHSLHHKFEIAKSSLLCLH